MEDWYDLKTGFKRMEAFMNDKLANQKLYYESELEKLNKFIAEQNGIFKLEKDEVIKNWEIKLEIENNKHEKELQKQKRHFEINVIPPLETQITNLNSDIGKLKDQNRASIAVLEAELANQLESSKSLIENTKKSFYMQLNAKTKVVESM